MKRSRNEGRPPRKGRPAGGGERSARSGYGSRDGARPRRKEEGDRERPFRRNEGEAPRKPSRSTPGRSRDEGAAPRGPRKPFRSAPGRSRDDRDAPRGPRRSYGSRDDRDAPRGPRRSYGSRDDRDAPRGPRRSYGSRDDRDAPRGPRKPLREGAPRRSYGRPREERPTEPRLYESRLRSTDKWNDAPPKRDSSSGTGDRVRKRFSNDAPPRGRRPFRDNDGPPRRERSSDRDDRPRKPYRDDRGEKPFFRRGKAPAKKQTDAPEDGLIRLNRYLAHSGGGSRREADDLIRAGVVKVNGEIVTELGTKVKPGQDIVHVEGQKMSLEVKRYVLLNKPKDTITTTDDPQDRKTVMALVADACDEKILPVGRLDRNTTGLLLLTNDGDLANRLTHPKYGIEKLYHATLDKNVTVEDLHRLTDGVQLDDGLASADEVSYVEDSKKEVGVRLHTGRNRVVRRMFEALGYDVVKLDRVVFAGLTKKDLPRGRWRHLTDAEVSLLKRVK